MTMKRPPTVDRRSVPATAGEDTATIASIRHRWSLLARADVVNLKTLENLAAAIQWTYGVGATQATLQVQEWAAGRELIRADIERGTAAAMRLGATTTPTVAQLAKEEVGLWH